MGEFRFVVEEAGCQTCAERVRSALAPLLTVDTISIDAASDTATVVAHADTPPSLDVIDAALAGASAGSDHTYRVQRPPPRPSV
jgi:heavy-metal-associated domain-containing protein